MKAKTIILFNHKGGVSKTLTTYNIAWIASRLDLDLSIAYPDTIPVGEVRQYRIITGKIRGKNKPLYGGTLHQGQKCEAGISR